ncbi:MAG: hypothetical protein ACTH6S_03355 [Mesonia sp.]|uniref:hypothetical protein n=1 Tax=Mesonia sp. TaxID=1960830 RepID=UPI003F98DBE7
MKKLLAVTALFAAFSFTSLEADASSKLKKRNCSEEAIQAYDIVYEYTGSMFYAGYSADAAYNGCISGGGSPDGA